MANSPGIVSPERGILVKCDTHKVQIALEQAVPAALIVLEFLTNALKHAFPAGQGAPLPSACIAWRRARLKSLSADDGVGLPLLRGRNSGMALTEILASQIGGGIEAQAGANGGTCMRLRFPIVRLSDSSAVPATEASLTAG